MATACTWTTSSKRATRYGKRARQHGGLRPGRAWAATRPGGVGIGWQRRAAWPGRARRPGRPARRPAGGYANTARPVLEVARKGLTLPPHCARARAALLSEHMSTVLVTCFT